MNQPCAPGEHRFELGKLILGTPHEKLVCLNCARSLAEIAKEKDHVVKRGEDDSLV